MKTPDEIKKGLECCANGNLVCTGRCVYEDDCCFPDCKEELQTDALAYIQQLESRLAKVERERDAAVEDIEKTCIFCKHSYLNNPGIDCCPYVEQCQDSEKFEWRGVCEENTKEE